MKYRNKTDILAQMLGAASKKGVTKTRLMYMAFVPHEQMSGLLDLLTEHSLVEFDEMTRLYQTTARGEKFVESYNNMYDCLAKRRIYA